MLELKNHHLEQFHYIHLLPVAIQYQLQGHSKLNRLHLLDGKNLYIYM